MFILFDSNVWISQVGLQSKVGAAVRHFAKRHGAIVAIPEIVKLEVEEKLTKSLLDLRQTAENSYRQLLPYMRKLQPIPLPSEEDLRKTVENIIPTFDIPTRHLPFNVDVARSSMMKVIRKIPPSAEKREEFRDGVIWAHCLELLDEDDVYLVTEDQDFYHERNSTKGLASNLVDEMQERSENHQVKLVPNLTELLEEIRIPFKLDTTQIFNSVRAQQSEHIEELLSSHGFELYGSAEGQVDCFATEEAQKVYFTFSFTQPCRDVTETGRRDGKLKFQGSGFLNPDTRETSEVQLSRTRLDYPDWEWKPGGPASGSVFVSAHFNAPMVHSIRVPLDTS